MGRGCAQKPEATCLKVKSTGKRLVKLKEAWILWKADPYLVINDEFMEKAKKLLRTAFGEIESYTVVIHWKRVRKLYQALKGASEIEKDLGL